MAGTGKRARETVLVLDFGSQYSRLILRRVRDLGVYSELVPHNADRSVLERGAVKGIILSGGPSSIYADDAPQAPDWLADCGLPVLGICYGMHLLGRQFGCEVAAGDVHEYGKADIRAQGDSPLLADVPNPATVWMSHGDRLESLPPPARPIASTDHLPVAAVQFSDTAFGLQFHPEVTHTSAGKRILANFLFAICSCSRSWTPSNFVEEAVAAIREQVGDESVLCALSGGVDSMVAAALLHRAIGDRLKCVFVDNGLLRRGEPDRVRNLFENHLKASVLMVDARERFLAALDGVSDPERKRILVGRTFIDVFEEQARELGEPAFLAQGTLYPDVIESTTPESTMGRKIKSHHNVGGLPERMKLKLVEPLRYLFKDEVRGIGAVLGLPPESVNRHPFPGPGLSIRIIGAVTNEKLKVVRACDWIVLEEIRRAGLYNHLWQAFAVLTDVRTVGVMGDYRTYQYVAAVRVVTSEDAMTADWAELPRDVLVNISTRIVNEVRQINRVVLDITSKPPGTIEWE